MLELLTRSKIRLKILLLFIYNQNREFYLSELAKIIGASVGTTQREANKLITLDLVHFKKKAGHNIYKLNKHFSLLAELKSIIKKTSGIEIELRKALDQINGISFAFLFGSYVKGGFKSDSDIDLFIIGADEDEIFKAIQKTERTIGRDINPHFATKKEFYGKLKTSSFYKDIVKRHLLIKGEESDFREFIKQPG